MKVTDLDYHVLYKFMIFYLQCCLLILSLMFYGLLMASSTAAITKFFDIPLNNRHKLLALNYFTLCYLLMESLFYSGSKMLNPRVKIMLGLSQ